MGTFSLVIDMQCFIKYISRHFCSLLRNEIFNFLVAPSHEWSDLSTHHSVRMVGWLVGCLFVC